MVQWLDRPCLCDRSESDARGARVQLLQGYSSGNVRFPDFPLREFRETDFPLEKKVDGQTFKKRIGVPRTLMVKSSVWGIPFVAVLPGIFEEEPTGT